MPFDPGETDTTSGQPPIQYPLDYMRATAERIQKNAQDGLFEHDQAWSRVLQYADSTPRDEGIPPAKMVLYPHADRLRASYEWQLKLAQALLAAADAMDTTDTSVATDFSD